MFDIFALLYIVLTYFFVLVTGIDILHVPFFSSELRHNTNNSIYKLSRSMYWGQLAIAR